MEILLDTDFLVNLFIEGEPLHEKTVKYMEEFDSNLFILKVVHYELATVLSRKLPHIMACNTLRKFESISFSTIHLTKDEEKAVWQEFYSQTKKNISFIDCANLVIARQRNMKIASFDHFYPKEFVF